MTTPASPFLLHCEGKACVRSSKANRSHGGILSSRRSVIQPAPAFCVASIHPVLPDDGEKDTATSHGAFQGLREVLTRLDGVDIGEDPLDAEHFDQAVASRIVGHSACWRR